MRWIVGVACFVFGVGCSSSAPGTSPAGSTAAGAAFATQLCNKIAACGQTVDGCQGAFAAIILSSSCQSTFLNASCADLGASPVAADLVACIPSCPTTTQTCNGDGTITVCASGDQYRYTCDGICAADSLTYSGTCGSSYMTQTSTTGDKCWCQ